MRRLLFWGALAALLVTVGSASAQTLVQGGALPIVPGHVGAWIYNGILGNGEGSAGCTTSGCNKITDLGITAPGTPFCVYDNPTDSTSGYHQLCVGADATISGTTGGVISFNAYGGATPLPLYMNLNGVDYPFPTALNTAISGGNPTLSSYDSQYFGTWPNQKAQMTQATVLSGTVDDTLGSFRDGIYSSIHDSDVTTYTQSHTNYGGRFASFGPFSTPNYLAADKNYIGLSAYALGNTVSTPLSGGNVPGVGGVFGEAYQYGTGTVDNEFTVHNPSAAGGSTGQSVSMAAVQATTDYSYAEPDDSTHRAYAVLASNIGTYPITAAFGANGVEYHALLDGFFATVKKHGIIMPGTASDATAVYAGTIIDYGSANGDPPGGSYTYWNGSVNGGAYLWVDSGAIILQADATSGLTVKGGYLTALPQVAAGTGKHFVCIDPTTHQLSEGTGASCN